MCFNKTILDYFIHLNIAGLINVIKIYWEKKERKGSRLF